MELTIYKNPWHDGTPNYGPAMFRHQHKPLHTYNGVEVYRIHESHFDYVKEGVCLTQRAGATKYKEVIDNLLKGSDFEAERAQSYMKP